VLAVCEEVTTPTRSSDEKFTYGRIVAVWVSSAGEDRTDAT
jgi:hypothetical protein